MAMQRRAFTLVEVLIVVVIMAVLAAVVIPQFSSSADDAKKATSEFNLSTLRSVIQIYKAQHNGRFPTYDSTAKSLTTLVSKTRVDGTIDSTTGTCGPYLVEFPQNPFTGMGQVKLITSDPATSADVTSGNTGGWLYNATTGSIWLDSDPGYSY
jgi:general secretion pathway protein G